MSQGWSHVPRYLKGCPGNRRCLRTPRAELGLHQMKGSFPSQSCKEMSSPAQEACKQVQCRKDPAFRALALLLLLPALQDPV